MGNAAIYIDYGAFPLIDKNTEGTILLCWQKIGYKIKFGLSFAIVRKV